MEILNTIWNTLTQPNELITKALYWPLVIIEEIVTLLLFTFLLNISSSTKQKVLYVVLTSFFSTISKLLIPNPYSVLINILLLLIVIISVFKVNVLKAILSILIPFICIALFEMLFSKVFTLITGQPYEQVFTVPIYRFIFALLIYFCLFVLYLCLKHFKISITILDNLSAKNKSALIFTIVLGFLAIYVQLYITFFYSTYISVPVTLLSMLILLAYFFVSLHTLSKTYKLEIANQDIENLQLYNKTLSILHDNIRAFKHDFNNIVQAIGRLCCFRGYGRAKSFL